MGEENAEGLRSVNRALRALELIAEAGELGVTELGRRLGVHKATASRLAATLARRGLLERDPVSGRYRLGVGVVRRPALNTPSRGKVLLAAMDEGELDRRLARGLERSTPRTVTDPDELRSQLAEVRRRGWAQTLEELEEGLNAVG